MGSAGAVLFDPIADGWRNQRTVKMTLYVQNHTHTHTVTSIHQKQQQHFRNASSFHDIVRNVSPFYLTAEKDGHVMVIIRGTLFEDEWCVRACMEAEDEGGDEGVG
jgi:hypothetical protein